jgi:hypothetical protein
MDAIDPSIQTQLIQLIQTQYWQNKDNKYEPSVNEIMPYFIGHFAPAFCSYYTYKDTIVGVITSRPLHIQLKGGDHLSDIYYVDYLCVKKWHRKRNIAPQLIQTHEFYQSHQNKKQIVVSLFKREDELTGIVPICIYKTYCFSTADWKTSHSLHSKIKIKLNDGNMHLLNDFMNQMKSKWTLQITPEVSNIAELMKTGNIIVKMLISAEKVVAAYWFRRTCLYLEKDAEVLSCFASINGDELTTEEFIVGFQMALCSIPVKYPYVSLEQISDNHFILDSLLGRYHPVVTSPMAYYLYNYISTPVSSEKCLIIH